MDWKLIFQLSAFGLITTIHVIPEKIEPFFWLAIFIFCVYTIVNRVKSKYFWHGFLVCMLFSVWMTAERIILYTIHPNVVKMLVQDPFLPTHPQLATLIMGPILGIAFGLVFGLFAFIGSLMVKKKASVQ